LVLILPMLIVRSIFFNFIILLVKALCGVQFAIHRRRQKHSVRKVARLLGIM